MKAELDTRGLNTMLNGLNDALLGQGQDVSTIVVDESRRLGRTCVNFVPPLRSKWGNPKKSGEMAIRRELNNLVSEAQPQVIDELGARFGTKNIRAGITLKSGRHQDVSWDNLDPLGQRIRSYHHAARGPRGKVKLERNGYPSVWGARVVVPTGTRDPYIKQVQSQVGKGKAAMARFLGLLGDKVPGWIARHFGAVGNTAIADITHAQDPKHPSVTFGSRAPGVDRARGSIQGACRFRAKAVARRIELVLSGYAKDVAAGIRARSRAKRTSNEPETPIEE